jgi:hypothetical protein
VPSRRKKRGALEVAGLRGKTRRWGGTDPLSQAELGVVELTTDKVDAGVGGMRAVGRGIGDNGKSGSRKRSKVSVTRVAPVLGIKT